MSKYFTNAFAAFREGPSTGARKIQDLPQKTIVEYHGPRDSTPVFGWMIVEYNGNFGYIADTLIEPYEETLPKDCVEIFDQTPEQNDFDQYFMLNGIKQTNWCGPLSICFSLGLTLKAFTEAWEVKAPSLWKRIKGAGRFSGTTSQDLIQMCDIFGVHAQFLEIATKDAWLNRSRYTPRVLKNLCETGHAVVACKIDGSTGRLRGSGVPHWVVITDIFPERTGGRVQIYNPAPNRIEEYSWEEAIASMNQPYGIFIPKVTL